MRDGHDLVPADKCDTAAARRATEADARSLEPVVDDLVGWCLDSNWPVARVLGPFLGRLGAPVIPAVRAVLDGTDGAAKYHVLSGIVREMSPETRRQLRASLTTLVTSPTEDDVAEDLPELAAELLTAVGGGT